VGPYNASAGEVWQISSVTLIVLLDGYVTVGTSENTQYRRRRALNIDTGKLLSFGDDSWIAEFSKRFA